MVMMLLLLQVVRWQPRVLSMSEAALQDKVRCSSSGQRSHHVVLLLCCSSSGLAACLCCGARAAGGGRSFCTVKGCSLLSQSAQQNLI